MVWLLPVSRILPERGAAWFWLLLPRLSPASARGAGRGAVAGARCCVHSSSWHAEALGPRSVLGRLWQSPRGQAAQTPNVIPSQFWRVEANSSQGLQGEPAPCSPRFRRPTGRPWCPWSCRHTAPSLPLSPHDLPCVSRVPSPYRVTRATLTHCGLNSCPLRPRYHIRPRSEVPGGCELGGGDTQPSRAPLTSDSQPVTAHAPQRRERSRRVSDLRAAPLPRKF